ncbi:MAG: cytochrome c, partial [Thermoanaerobaculia bacterium]|nr:cytochrome c [Thermoanaerobaculia bacterium]
GAILAAPLMLALLPVTAVPVPAEETVDPPGKVAFLADGCNLCHEVSGEGIERKSKSDKMMGRDMTGIGEDYDREFAKAYILREAAMEDGTKHKKPFKGTDEELEAILDWLATL